MPLLQRPSGSDKQKGYRQIGLLTAIPAIMVAAPLVGYFSGQWVDGKLGTEPYLAVSGVVLGFVAAGREIAVLIRKAQALDREENDDGN
jgi:ATP synthase protein I